MPEHADYLNSLPNPLSRHEVAAQFVGADQTEDAAVRAFLASMVWGHGRNGYGAFRTAGVLEATDHAGARLLETMQVARAGGGAAGFDHLARHRLKGLGVAFATKYLYFCLADSDTVPPAPILDAVVSDWLAMHAGWRPKLKWKVEDYRRYCDLVSAWSTQLQEPSATVEYLMFASGMRIANQWADPKVTVSGVAAVLEALDQAAEAFEAIPGPASVQDEGAFREGVRALRQLALARA